jgi:hypothetical protein
MLVTLLPFAFILAAVPEAGGSKWSSIGKIVPSLFFFGLVAAG